MMRRLLLCALALVMAGCGVYDKGYGPSDGLSGYPGGFGYGSGGSANITFGWTFEGMSCAQAGVALVVVSMPGQYLQYEGRYPCTYSGYDGVTLGNFASGSYAYTLDGYDAQHNLLYETSGSVQIYGVDQYEKVDLMSVSGPTPPGGVYSGPDSGTCMDDAGTTDTIDAGTTGGGTLFDAGTGGGGYDAGTGGGTCGCGIKDGGVSYHNDLSWAFPAADNAPTCGDELSSVVLTLDGQAIIHECGAGLYPSRITLPTLTPGSHSLAINAIDSSGRSWASRQLTIDIPSNADSYQTVQVPWIVGSAALDWSFYSCDGLQTFGTCAEAGVDTIAVNFQDSSGFWLYADAHGNPTDSRFDCVDPGSLVLRAVSPGSYTMFVAGYGRVTGMTYEEYPGQGAYPVTVQAGVFYRQSSPSSDFLSVDLYQLVQ